VFQSIGVIHVIDTSCCGSSGASNSLHRHKQATKARRHGWRSPDGTL